MVRPHHTASYGILFRVGTDPWIGSIVLAHTNLTEIKDTLQLFQNVKVDWSQVNIGCAERFMYTSLSDPMIQFRVLWTEL